MAKSRAVFLILLALSLAFPVEAALSPSESGAGCIKDTFRGDASTYNPNLPGWRTGGQGLATGGRYNPNEYEAALQLDLAKRYGCGYGSGKVCNAVVQAPNGRAMTVRINDNGPLVPGRVIDLNEKSMQYISGGGMGHNSGVVKNVTVTLLCGIEGMALGPLEAKDREAWASRTFHAEPANTGYVPSSAINVSSQSPYSASAPSYASPSYSTPPAMSLQGNASQPLSYAAQSPAYNPPVTQTSLYPAGYQPNLRPISIPTSEAISTFLPTLDGFFPISATIRVSPSRLSRGSVGNVSWTSAGLQGGSCAVTATQGEKKLNVGEGGSGARQIKIGTNSSTGTFTFTLRCASAKGERIERSATLEVI